MKIYEKPVFEILALSLSDVRMYHVVSGVNTDGDDNGEKTGEK